MNKKNIQDGYTVELDTVDKKKWYSILLKFDDASLYQTLAFDEVRSGSNNLSHILLKKNGEIESAAQVLIKRIPIINKGIAYVRWGPIWKKKNSDYESNSFRQMVRALSNEYVLKRGLFLRILPNIFNNEKESFTDLLHSEGYTHSQKVQQQRTFLIDLSPSLEELRKGLKQKWRNCLNRAIKNDLDIAEGSEENLFKQFNQIYGEMYKRKKYGSFTDISEYATIQKDLPEDLKMRVLICSKNHELCAGAIFSAMGNVGIYLFGGTTNFGMKSNGAYLIQWKFLEWLKKNNFRWFDLHGINPETNPGTFHFKQGLAGKNYRDVCFIGTFEYAQSQIDKFLIYSAEKSVLFARKIKSSLK